MKVTVEVLPAKRVNNNKKAVVLTINGANHKYESVHAAERALKALGFKYNIMDFRSNGGVIRCTTNTGANCNVPFVCSEYMPKYTVTPMEIQTEMEEHFTPDIEEWVEHMKNYNTEIESVHIVARF